MPITSYTTYDDVRAALGVSDQDLGDSTLGLTLYDDALAMELAAVSPTIETLFASTSAQPSPTDAEKQLLRATRAFATYVVARELVPAMRMFAVQQVTDSKASMSRFNDPLAQLAKDIEKKYQLAKDALVAALTGVVGQALPSTPRQYLYVVSPAYDPVTG